jgi:hypothetical protein
MNMASGRYSFRPLTTTLVPVTQEDNVLYSSYSVCCSDLIHAISLSCLCRIANTIPQILYATFSSPPRPLPLRLYIYWATKRYTNAHIKLATLMRCTA